MAKRSRRKIETIESKMLKILRNSKGVSQRSLSVKMKISQTRINHMESGREDVTEEYVAQFLRGIGSNYGEWVKLFRQYELENELKEMCKNLIDQMDCKKVKIFYDLICRF